MMWNLAWRQKVWDELKSPWDLIVIGGGITGAGILREATRIGLRALLVEGNDFTSGTSSRSSKLVHGGLRYLNNGQIRLTYESVRERENLLRTGRGLIYPLGFVMPSYKNDKIPGWVFHAGLIIYDLLGLKWRHQRYGTKDVLDRWPFLRSEGLLGGYRFFDALTDDARLVLRVIQEAVMDGGTAINYAWVEDLLRNKDGHIRGIVLRDQDPMAKDHRVEVEAPIVINATGAWADELRILTGGDRRLRLLRGSHLIFPAEKVPLSRAVSFYHPHDQRPVFIYPWEGTIIVGTTDVDQGPNPKSDPSISTAEAEYLMIAARYAFPPLELNLEDVLSTFSGIRAVVDTGKADPSKESREHVIWQENGLVTVTGGKLTTFRVMAHDALRAIRHLLPGHPRLNRKLRMLDKPPVQAMLETDMEAPDRLRLLGRYGANAPGVVETAEQGELTPIGETTSLWAELRWAARSEAVLHLDDLLLRRLRLGIVAPQGGIPWMDRIRNIVQMELGWDDQRWQQEEGEYIRLWHQSYFLPVDQPELDKETNLSQESTS
jgi:glycerol-3-phosphate dehydrogenase